jgi:cytochrome c peroxidase
MGVAMARRNAASLGVWGWAWMAALAVGCGDDGTTPLLVEDPQIPVVPEEPEKPEEPETPREPPLPIETIRRIRDLALDAGLAPLVKARIPEPPSTIVDREAAVRLGKALFWDTALGSDGQTACATCHHAAGADSRRENVVHPGPNGLFETPGVTGPGQRLPALARLLSDDRIGSPGAVAAELVSVSGSGADECRPVPSPIFGNHRQVTARNAPTVIGAAMYREQFWDGRAASDFNGRDVYGRTRNSTAWFGLPVPDLSLASQSLGPPVNAEEMSCEGRRFNGPHGIAARLLDRPVLAGQQVAPTDSALGAMSAWPDPGLRCGSGKCTYRDLVGDAFGRVGAATADAKFSEVFGMALAVYQATLIPDDTPYDRWLAGDDLALSAEQVLGLEAFAGPAKCAECHAGPELTDASLTYYELHGPVGKFGNDQGYHNIGVRPPEEDLGRAGRGPRGVSYSVSGSVYDRGAFKTPGLRNVALTPPYFHNGGAPNLQAVMNFYDRGGDHESESLSPHMEMLGLDPDIFQAIVGLMEHGFTDCRVATSKAPFDHPSIDIPGGPSLPAVGAEGEGNCP